MRENPDELQRRIEALQERVSRLSLAILRISASLDLDTVLQEVVDSARALTGARYGLIATVDDAGRAPGVRHLRLDARRTQPTGRLVRRTAALQALPGP